jgi:type I restriction enzyme M protein
MGKLSLETLESWLWSSANILRGSIDSSDFKNYIFGLLFLKRANDVFEEEVHTIMQREGYSREDSNKPFNKNVNSPTLKSTFIILSCF